ncbi:MAG: histidine kinase [Bacteroidota bacterium]|nr:histidine kinase [Bacteroidota bacterium]
MNIPGIWNRPFNFFRFILANIALSFILILSFMSGGLKDWNTFLIAYLWAFSISITQWGGLQLIHAYIDKKISWIDTPVKKTFIQILGFLSYSITAFILVQLINYFVWMGKLPSESWNSIIKSLPYTLMISSIISLIFTAVGFFFAWKRSFQHAEKLKVEMLAYKYESLRNQINPHFLFNSLNVLSDLVYDDQRLAVKFIQQMSDLFRYVLDSRDKELVPLKDELEFIRSYTFMLKTRFEQKLIIDIDVHAEPDDYIVPMSLQLLIENAVKHNEISEAFPLHISVRKTEEWLEVENSLQLKKVGDDSKKTGLKNVTQQFAFFSEKPIRIFTSDDLFLVRLPILKALVK